MYALGTYATEVQYIVLYVRNNDATIFGVQKIHTYSPACDLYVCALKEKRRKRWQQTPSMFSYIWNKLTYNNNNNIKYNNDIEPYNIISQIML